MAVGKIETNKLELDDVLREIERGNIQLPDFQRSWMWRDSQIKSLLASVSLGIPIGTILTTEGDQELSHRPFAGVNLLETTPAKTLVLDGQQRLTALFQACKSGQPVTTESRKDTTQRHYYFDMKKCIEEDDREDCVISENANRSKYDVPTKQYEDEIFPTGMMFKYRQWRDDYLEHYDHDKSKRELVHEFEDIVVHSFGRYQIPEVRMSSTDLEVIAITFEKTNDRGTKLDAFNIITSKMKREGLNLREDWEQQENVISTEPVLAKVNETQYLKAITLLATKAGTKRVSARRKDMLYLKREEYEAYRHDATQGFISAAELLKELGIGKAKDLVHVPQAIVMAAVYAHCDSTQTNTIRARETVEQWYWTTLLNESYGGRTTDEQLAHDFSELIRRLTSTSPAQFSVLPGRPFNSNRLLSGRQNSLTVAVQSLLKQHNEPRDWMKGIPIKMLPEIAVEMHHVFPRKWCKDNGINEGLRESVPNLSLIDAETNKIIGGKAPSLYLKELQAKAGNISDSHMDRILESHLIPVKELRRDDFQAFHEKRAALLKKMIEGAIGPEMIR